MPVKLNSAGGGSVTFDVGSIGSTYTLIAPANNGTLISSGTSSRLIPQAAMPTGSILQTQYTSSRTRTTVDSTSFVEPSSAYRVSITPSSSSSYFIIKYFMMLNPGGNYASNTLFSLRAFRILNGVTTYSVTSAGASNGSRNAIAGVGFRPEGYDTNDSIPISFYVIDSPATTSACTYGFEFKRETGGGGIMYFGYTAGDNSNWGWDTNINLVAQEIAQ